MFVRKFSAAATSALLFVASTGAVFAQATSGTIVGTVTDATGALLPAITVTAVNKATGVSYPATTTGSGEYRIVNVLPGIYNITATAPGFAPSVLRDFGVDSNKDSTAAFKLTAGNASSVEVSTEAAVALDTTTSQLQQDFSTKEIADLPISAVNLLSLSFLAPGVSSTGGLGEGTGPSISGQRARDNSFTVEGTDNNNKTVTGNVVNVQDDAAQEFALLQNVFNAEYGHSNGGQFNVVLKSGTNQYRGKVYEYFQNRNLNALDNFQRLGGITSQPRFDQNRFGGQLGGPIIKDKLFFFGDYEEGRLGQKGTPGSFCAPTAAGYALLNTYKAGSNLSVLENFLAPSAGGDPAKVCNTTVIGSGAGAVSNPDTIAIGVPAGTPGSVGANQLLIPIGQVNVVAPSFTNSRWITTSIDYVPTSRDNVRGRYSYQKSDGIDTGANLPAFFAPEPFRGTIGSVTYVHTFTPNVINEARIGFNRSYGPVLTAPGTLPRPCGLS